MLIQYMNGFLLDIDEVSRLKHLKVVRRRLLADILLRRLQRQIGVIQPITRLHCLPARRLVKERHADLSRIAPLCAVTSLLFIGISADIHCSGLPCQCRTERAAGARKLPLCLINPGQCLVNGSIILQRHANGLV